MAFDITFSLTDTDLTYFKDVMRKACSGAATLDEKSILEKVKALSTEVKTGVPEFVVERLNKLDTLVKMVEDKEWQIPDEERKDVISALAYFGNPTDLIPDHIPALGFLDDAIMIELVVNELHDNIEAYVEFSEYREREKSRKDPSTITTGDWLEAKRKELHNRMYRRRSSRSGRSSFRIF
ncbi:YkvA family protein [Paraglaciecola hydrolytica]|uniref:DUF1232 domain-containing protein n=1 Tax=Paraglaciecola hydrolytica TaxID=1799789 RepID=A0A148KMC7_9ALTE|nr:YkvA family protein [Paraglaciecola hydrolytica]KXI27431.1 hypothetical protein AX660_22205 [Paraglaciecola hydrolytica]